MTTNMTDHSAQAAPGWYDDPENPGSPRYWDGSSWNAPEKKGMATGKKVAIGIGVVVAGFFGLAVIGAGMTDATTTSSMSKDNGTEVVVPEQEPEALPAEPPMEAVEEAEPTMTVAQENAVQSAQSYIDMGGFSKQGLIGQLEYEKFSKKDATFAANNVDANWNQQAAQSAESYMDMGGFSRQGLIDQLEYEGFTTKQATFGANSVGL